MKNDAAAKPMALIDEILTVAQRNRSVVDAKQTQVFVRHYFADAALQDLGSASPPDLYGAAACHLRLAQQRNAGEANIVIYTPEFDVHGWQSTHTVIDIVNDDMPFLVDSVTMALYRRNINLHRLLHPVLAVARDAAGRLTQVRPGGATGLRHESFIHIEIDRLTDAAAIADLRSDIAQVLADIGNAVMDDAAMRAQLRAAIADTAGAPVPDEQCKEVIAFLEWIEQNNFVVLGYTDYKTSEEAGEVKRVPDSGLGILRDVAHPQFGRCLAGIPGAIAELAKVPSPLNLVKADARSTIHRPGYLDFIGIKRYNRDGSIAGEHCFVGLYAAPVYHSSVRSIPVLRAKVAHVLSVCGYIPNSHGEKTLLNALETYPRDELIEIHTDDLVRIAQGIVNLQERQRVRVFLRQDAYGRYVSALVFLPRDSFDTGVRMQIARLFAATFKSQNIEFFVLLTESTLARIHFIVRTPVGTRFEYDAAEIEQAVSAVVRGWGDELLHSVIEHFGEERGNACFRKYARAFPLAYREQVPARSAVFDIEKMDMLSADQPLQVKLYAPFASDGADQHCKLFGLEREMVLSESLPIFENLGVTVLNEHPYRIDLEEGVVVNVSDFALRLPKADALEHPATRHAFQELLARLFRRECESDGFNRLSLLAGLDWRQINLLRAYGRYMRQAGIIFSQKYIEQCLANHPLLARLLVELFQLRFNPSEASDSAAEHAVMQIREALAGIDSLDEDRILNGFLSLVLATLRTNYFQADAAGAPKDYLSFKFSSRDIPFLPEPRPLYEIFVYSRRIEGVHLRGSRVARGGLRWSDRMEDYRTEVLGLVKAQMVKNAVIVPMGSKGGFVCKQLPPASNREAWLAEGVTCYKTFISGLLDLTDNLVGGSVVPPRDVRRIDGDDPYLVVAADKGTATFSDIANGLAGDYGFWLGDAFASGGSVGYDHKKMGITARGAWEAVKRHFRHLGVNTQTTEFTVIGIGDMSGDVFGNGMLLSEHIQLLAAFDHRHIFLDPNPDAATGFAERKRLFDLPRSSWDDYDRSLISEGGGIYPRSAKSIPLSPQVKAWLEVDADALTPSELIHAILKAKADLLYNGGIGTYVKASTQSHADANDRNSDAIRVDGRQLRVKVMSEGGNLGLTQKGRIEFAEHGGRLCTDAIDNSAGVDCSDHEVNIKILLGQIVSDGDLTIKQRNDLLAAMTDEVAQMVLRNNYLQTQALAIERRVAPSLLDAHGRLMSKLESSGELNRAIEFLPDDKSLDERRQTKRGLTPPELAVLLAYSKISLNQALLDSKLPDQPDFNALLVGYFPQPLRERYAIAMANHPLKREIIANQLANEVVNRMGPAFLFQLHEEIQAAPADIAAAWYAANRILRADALWPQMESLDNLVSADVQLDMMLTLRDTLAHATRWLLHKRQASMSKTISTYESGVSAMVGAISRLLPSQDYPQFAAREAELGAAGVAQPLASLLARAEEIASIFDIIEVAHTTGQPLERVGASYFSLARELELDWLKQAAARLPQNNRWQALARSELGEDLQQLHSTVLVQALGDGRNADQPVPVWLERHSQAVVNCRRLLAELKRYDTPDLAMLSASLGEFWQHFEA